MRFYQELKRRKVFRVLVAYLVAAWLLLQVAEVLSSILGLPDWAPRLVLLLLVIGFVPALILAWAYELTPDGIKRDADTEDNSGASRVTVDEAYALTDAEAQVGTTDIPAVDNGSGFSFDQTGYVGAVEPGTSANDAWWTGWIIEGSLD